MMTRRDWTSEAMSWAMVDGKGMTLEGFVIEIT
jgi:hypothetical protein